MNTRTRPHPCSRLAHGIRRALALGLFAVTLVLLEQARAAEATGLTPAAERDAYLAPTSILATPDGTALYVAAEATGEVLVLDAKSGKITARVAVGTKPSGLALSADGTRLYVTASGPQGSVGVVDTARREVIQRIPAGYDARSPVLSPDGRTLFVCNRFNDDVSVIDLAAGRETRRIHVAREPFSAVLTRDGRYLLVANHLPAGRSDADEVSAALSVIDVAAGSVCRTIALPNGSTMLREIRTSPDGRYAVLVHILARFHLPTTQIERGWINSNAASILDLAELKLVNTVLLDSVDSGASTPWGVAWSADGRHLVVSHAGTHELSVIDFPALLAKLAKVPAALEPGKPVDTTAATQVASDVPNDLSFLVGVRERIRIPGKAPRSVTVAAGRAWAANYFSDTVVSLDLAVRPAKVETIPLGPAPQMTRTRLGELYFNDASLCFQGWQACSSCHSHDARVDGMNWDNLNDGIGNPKNSKSLLLSHETPPSMALGVRSNAYVAVRAGIRNSLFTVQPPEVAESMDEYLKALRPMPSPHLVNGRLSTAAERGRQLFESDRVGCADCHRGKQLTDQRFHDVGTISQYDSPTDRFDTPTLLELWRTGPYLHDGSAVTLRDVLTGRNAADKHGHTRDLSPGQLDDLAEYLLSL